MLQMITGKKTVASVMAGFLKTLDDLRAVAAASTKEADDKSVEMAQAEAARNSALSEATSANKIAARIEALIGGDDLAETEATIQNGWAPTLVA